MIGSSVPLCFRSQRKNWLLVGWPHKGAEHPETIFDGEVMNRLVGQVEVCPAEEDNAGKDHYQVFVQFKEQVRFTAVTKLFPSGLWSVIPQKYGSAKSMQDYCTKEDTRKPGEEPFTFGASLIEERKSTARTRAIADIKDGKSLRTVSLDNSEAWVVNHVGLTSLHKYVHQTDSHAKFSLSSFTWPPITDWSVAHVIYGPPNKGKTQFALAHFKSPLMVSHVDELSKFDGSVHDGIVFDDMEFLHYPRSSTIHLIDTDHGRPIHIRYACAWIPAETKKIFTTNRVGGTIFVGQYQDEAIDRRIRCTKMIGLGYKPKRS